MIAFLSAWKFRDQRPRSLKRPQDQTAARPLSCGLRLAWAALIQQVYETSQLPLRSGGSSIVSQSPTLPVPRQMKPGFFIHGGGSPMTAMALSGHLSGTTASGRKRGPLPTREARTVAELGKTLRAKSAEKRVSSGLAGDFGDGRKANAINSLWKFSILQKVNWRIAL
jgi:hypothetical protein